MANLEQTVGSIAIDPQFNKCLCGAAIKWPVEVVDSWECICGRIWTREEKPDGEEKGEKEG